MTALALMPLTLHAQPAAEIIAPTLGTARTPSNSTLDIPIEEIAATGGGCAVLDKDFPGLRSHTMYQFFKAMTLRQIAAMSHGQITADMLVQARADLSALPIKLAARRAHGDGETPEVASPADQESVSLPK